MSGKWPTLKYFCLITACLCLPLSGCGEVEVKPDSASGEDKERPGAKRLRMETLTDDYLSAKEGDNTDWKYVKVEQQGILQLTVYWDNRDVDAIIDVRDRFGALLDSRKHSSELEKDKIELRVKPGTHFVRLFTEGGKSVYTINAEFTSFVHDDRSLEQVPVAVEDYVDVPPVEVGGLDPAPQPRGRRRGRGRRRRGGSVPQGGPPPSGVNGTILKMVNSPKASQKWKSFITLNIGANDGVKQGQRAVLLDRSGGMVQGVSIRIVKVTAKASVAQCSATVERLAGSKKVRVIP
ncbi:MAG: hypothetical protein ACE366_31665 [Bradymonadia bacterium]